MATHNKKSARSKTQSKFADVPKTHVKRSRFDRSHGHKTTFGYGIGEGTSPTGNTLVPIYCDEVLPGDTFSMKSTGFARLATPLHPFMDNLYLDVHYFFVPNRLIWDDFERFMGEKNNPGDPDPSVFTVPQQTVQAYRWDSDEPEKGNIRYHDLPYYFGLPMQCANHTVEGGFFNHNVSALPFRAYRLIWNEWYRDQNLQDSLPNHTGAGPDPVNDLPMLPRGKRKDYFTSALPWPQKGDPITIPVELTGNIPVEGNFTQSAAGLTTRGTPLQWEDGWLQTPDSEVVGTRANLDSSFTTAKNVTTINDLRTAFQIQKLLEKDARGGTRYIELILSHFGVQSQDSRLQRPEYLGGSSSRIGVQPVPNTTGTDESAQGDLAGYGTTVNNARFKKSFTEHGIILGLVSYRADLTYQRGIERMWSRKTRYDFYWPALAHLGEQAILNKEIHFQGRNGGGSYDNTDDEVFGYQERYAEYRYKPSRVTGLFNSDADNSLDVWHLAQDFNVNNAVNLNDSFIRELPPVERIIAVPTEPYFIADFWFDLKCDRPMPTYAVPGMVDHF